MRDAERPEHVKAEDGGGLASNISKTTCKEGSNLYGVDLEGKKGCQVYTLMCNTYISEKQVSGQKKKFSSKLVLSSKGMAAS